MRRIIDMQCASEFAGPLLAYGTSEGVTKAWDTRGRTGARDKGGRTGGRKLSGRLGSEHFKALEKLARIHEGRAKNALADGAKQTAKMHQGDAADVRKFASLVKSGDFKGADRHGRSLDTDPREQLYTFRRVGPAVSRAWQERNPSEYARHADFLDQSSWRRSAGGTEMGTKEQQKY